jgi:anti-anti-sigma factor
LKRKHAGSPIPVATERVIDAAREGDWLPPEEFRSVARSAAEADCNVVLNLEGIDHLDASALQILLALAAEQKKRSKTLRLANASLALSRWFEYAGGREHIS